MITVATIGLRPASTSDLTFIDTLCRRSFDIVSEGVGYPRCETVKEMLAEFRLYENSLEESLYVITDGLGECIGVTGCLFSPGDREAYLIGPLVAPANRGEAVLDGAVEAIERVADAVFKRLTNCVVEDNSLLIETLVRREWHPGKRHIEMVWPTDAGGRQMVVRWPELRRLVGRDDEVFPGVAHLLGTTHSWDDDYEDHLEELLEDGYAVAYIAEDDRPVARAVWTYVEGTDFCRLEYVSVEPNSRRRGLRSVLVTSVLRDGVDKGVASIYLSLDAENGAAHRLYLRRGFRDTIRSVSLTREHGALAERARSATRAN